MLAILTNIGTHYNRDMKGKIPQIHGARKCYHHNQEFLTNYAFIQEGY